MRIFLRIAAVLLVVAAFAVTTEAIRERAIQASDREAMRIGVEDVARRVRTTSANLAILTEINNNTILAKVRVFARMIQSDPALLTDFNRFQSCCKLLDVDELHVSDERGVLIQSVPKSNIGFDMNSAEQSRPFMRALKDKSFELVQDLGAKAIGGKLFQYAGVARLDQPGIVQVGHRAERLIEARKLADIGEIARTTRIGRNGKVFISKIENANSGETGFHIEQLGDDRIYVLDANVGAHRVHVVMPVFGTWISNNVAFLIFCIFDLFLVVLMVLSCLSSMRELFHRNWQALCVLFGASPDAHVLIRKRSSFVNPVLFSCLLLFVAMLAGSYIFLLHATRIQAEDRLLNASQDMRDDIDTCVDQQLFYQGSAICKSYGSPEAMAVETVKEVMRRYDLDELNVVNEQGVIIAGDLAEIGFRMDSNSNSEKFNCLLRGEVTYSQPFRGAIENPNLRRKYAGVAFPPPAKGYIQMGLDEHRLKDSLDYRFAALASSWLIGERGFFVVAKDETGEIDSCGLILSDGTPAFKRGDTLAGIGFDALSAPKSPSEFFHAKLYGEDCLCLSDVRCFHRYIAAIPMSEIDGGFRKSLLTASLVLFALFAIITIFMSRLSRLVTSLKGYIADARARDEKDMSMAKAIQSNVLPTTFPPYPEIVDFIDIYAHMRTAREVGGDFYDFFFVSKGRLAIVIADVTGKGVPAALFMMRAKTTIQGLLKSGMNLSAAVSEANVRLSEGNDASMFVTAWIGVVNLSTGLCEFVNAGHNPPIIRYADASVRYLMEKCGPPLAAFAGLQYRSKTVQLNKDDTIVLYTDGVTEATNPALNLYGEPRLSETLSILSGDISSRFVIEKVVESVDAFANGAEQADDITLLALQFNKPLINQ